MSIRTTPPVVLPPTKRKLETPSGAPQVVAFVLSVCVFLPLVPIVGVALGAVLGFTRRRRSNPRRKWAVAAVVAGLVVTLAQIAIVITFTNAHHHHYHTATEGLDKIKHGAKAFYQADHFSEAGELLTKRFPKTTAWTPRGTCCKQEGNKCKPGAGEFSQPGWRDLHFSIDDPVYYQFRFTASGSGKHARFIIESRADLDCDGTFSLYKMLGDVNDRGEVVVRGPIVENELE